MKKNCVVITLILLASTFGKAIQVPQKTKPTVIQNVGMSPGRLKNAHDRLEAYVSFHKLGSAVGLIARSGQVVFLESVGEAGPGVPMPNDAIFGLAAINKTITSVTAL